MGPAFRPLLGPNFVADRLVAAFDPSWFLIRDFTTRQGLYQT